MAEVQDLLSLIEDLAPVRYAADWDNCGLMVGRRSDRIRKVALALDPTPETVQAARDMGAQVLLTHHPLIFRPLKKIDLDDHVGATAALAIKLDVAVISAHTNLDAAAGGVSQALARRLELVDVRVLDPVRSETSYKLAVYAPIGYEDQIIRALSRAGVADGRSFKIRGEGYGGPSTDSPANGANMLARRPTAKLEMIVPGGNLNKVREVLSAALPEKDPAYDVYPLAPVEEVGGFGCIGRPKRQRGIGELVEFIKEKLDVPAVRVAAPQPGAIKRIAVMGGSGGSYLQLAKYRGAQVFVTGDIGYHQARETEHLGLCVVDAGHWATERPVLEDLAASLTGSAGEKALSLEFEVVARERDPWAPMEEYKIES